MSEKLVNIVNYCQAKVSGGNVAMHHCWHGNAMGNSSTSPSQ